MSKRFQKKNQDFLYFTTKYGDAIPRRPIGKINVINVKSIAEISKDKINASKKEEKIPTARDVINDYLESTSVHGLQYFGKTSIEVGIPGKILWTCTILTCFVCLSLMVMQFLRRYNENPTNTYIKTFDAPIFQAPFPAVTICPGMPISKRKRLDLLESVILPDNVSREQALKIFKYGHYMTRPYGSKGLQDIDQLKALLSANKWSVSEFLKTLITCEDVFESCWWSAERIDCTRYIKATYSSNGLCCSFNYLLENYVGSQKGQPKPKPLSSADYGRWSGLKLVINKEMLVFDEDDEYNFTNFLDTDGITVMIHHRMDFPGLNTNMYTLQMNQELEIAIKPQLIQKPEGLQHRNKENDIVPVCIAENENSLDYFPIYRYSNCYANCRIKAMIQFCGCVPFIYDFLAEFYDVQRCELDRLHCIQENVKLIGIVKDTQNENFTCSCRTPCENMNYEGFPNAISLMKFDSSNASVETAVIRVFMYSQTFQILVSLSAADETYLLASVGGIFSLFLGCSFLSVVEIFYFTYLLCRAIFLRRKEKARTQQAPVKNFVNDRRYVY